MRSCDRTIKERPASLAEADLSQEQGSAERQTYGPLHRTSTFERRTEPDLPLSRTPFFPLTAQYYLGSCSSRPLLESANKPEENSQALGV